MSDAPDRDQKQFDPSPRRIQQARAEGNVFQSRDIVSIGQIITGVALILYGTGPAFDRLKLVTVRSFTEAPQVTLTLHSIPALFFEYGLEVTIILLPFLVAIAVVSTGLHIFQTGFNVSMKPVMPKGSRINPMEGMKRIFSTKGLMEMVKTLLKVGIVAPVAYTMIRGHMGEIAMLHTAPIASILSVSAGWISDLLLQIVMLLAIVAGLEYGYERWQYYRDLKMTHQEMKDESKEQEGDPHIKGKRRQFARKLLSRPRLDHAILKADVVITNPTHYAVALRYHPAEGGAPRVLVKGIRKRAQRIKALAKEHSVPTIENRPLARALYNAVTEGMEIPEELYPAVAAVLAEIYRQRGTRF